MITINELFSGIGAQVAALKRLGIDYKVVGISEIDTAAIQSYERMNGCVRNYGDISKIEKLDYADLWTYSFPCQDLSVAGKKSGISEGTRSGLLLEVERLLEVAMKEKTLPKFLLLENVKNLVGKKFKPDFDRWLNKLSELGYNNYWKVLNAKDYGVPQNRERVFVVSIRKDLNQTYVFPEKKELKFRLKDLLESEVDEKYYLPQEKVEKLALNLNKDVSNTIRCGGGGSLDGKHTWDLVVGSTQKNAYKGSTNSVSPCLTEAMGMGGGQIPMVAGVIEPLIAASRGRNPENPSCRDSGIPTVQMLEVNESGCSNTLTTVQKDNLVVEPNVLTTKRTEYGKTIRKEYEAGNIQEPRHNMTEMKPRTDGISNTLTTVQKDNWLCVPINTCTDGTCQALTAHLHRETANDCTKFECHLPATGVLAIKANTKKGYDIAEEGDSINLERPNSTTRRGRIGKGKAQTLTTSCNQGVVENTYTRKLTPKYCSGVIRLGNIIETDSFGGNPERGRVYDDKGISPCLSTMQGGGLEPKILKNCRIRKLTPREYWRLMGFTDEEFDKARGKFLRIENKPVFKVGSDGLNHKVGTTPTEIYEQSNTQLYKQAGNSIVVDVLVAIFKNLNLEEIDV